MAGGQRRSLQDLIRGRQRSGFIGRQSQVIQYKDNLVLPVDDERRRFLFNIHGDAGVGKTYLTKQLRQIADDSGALTAYTDETIDDVTSAMTVIAEQFAGGGVRLGEFAKRAAAYKQRRHELESDPQAPDSVAAFVTKTAVTIGLTAARDVPMAGSLLAPVDATATAEQIDRARVYLARKFRDHALVRLLLSPADELTPVFVTELNRAASDRPVALFFDTYERTAPLLDRWLRDLYVGRYGELPETLITTISGQRPLNPNLWGDYLPVITDIPLEPFSDAEARQFLASKNIADESTIEVILTLSGRLPMWLATLADARPNEAADIGDPAGEAVERFLKWENDPDRRTLAVAAALPRTLNQDVLGAITLAHNTRELFDWLCRLPFVTRKMGSWRYHEVVRAAMLRLQRAQAPSEWRFNHIALAKANAQWATEATSSTDEVWTNEVWIDHTREEVYHLLCADPLNNLPRALTSAVKAAEIGPVRARQWARLLADAGRDIDHPVLRQWGQRLQDGIRVSDLTQYLSYLINDGELDQVSLGIALEERGEHHRLANRNDEALADFDRAIELDPNRTRAIAGRGQTYWAMGRHDLALTDLTRAAELTPNYPWAITSRGEVYLDLERYDEALADFDRAIELDPSDAWSRAWRGEICRVMKRYDEALADLTRAIELDPTDIWAITVRGQTYQDLERYDEALADLTRAIELDPTDTWAITTRGRVYHDMRRSDEAFADLDHAIELDPTDAWAIGTRGSVYQDMGHHHDEALADLTQAIELDPSRSLWIASRGETYLMMGRYDEALADLTRAIELDPASAWANTTRARVHLDIEHYDEALADLTRAIELDPTDIWAIDRRAEVYLDLDRCDEALADLNRAIELDPSRSWAIATRAQMHLEMGRCDEALADLTRAIELDPTNAWAIGSRAHVYKDMERYDEALADFSRAIEVEPGMADTLGPHLAQLADGAQPKTGTSERPNQISA